MQIITYNCPSCGAKLNIDPNTKESFNCEYCGILIVVEKKKNEPSKYCKFCGKSIHFDAVICTYCGRLVEIMAVQKNETPKVETPQIININNNSYANNNNNNYANNNNNLTVMKYGKPKDKWVAWALCFFLGGLGAHKFYEGKVIMGVIYLFTLGFFGIGWFIDIFILLCKPNPYYV
jgi:restriction system protein